MSGKNIVLISAAIAAAGASTVGLVLNSKKMKLKRMAKRTSNALYTVGTVMRALSFQVNAD